MAIFEAATVMVKRLYGALESIRRMVKQSISNSSPIISSLYNPQSFLTAICQVTAQAQKLELDKLVTWTDITKNSAEEIESLAKDEVILLDFMFKALDGTFRVVYWKGRSQKRCSVR